MDVSEDLEPHQKETEASPNAAEDNELEDSEESDDDVQITIGDIQSVAAATYSGYHRPEVKIGKPPPEEYEVPMDDVEAHKFNLEAVDFKPWKQPGADVSDFFNFGFNEDSWQNYCDRQRKLRLECPNTTAHSQQQQAIPSLAVDSKANSTVNTNSKYSGLMTLKKAGPPPLRKEAGSIDVICSRTIGLPEDSVQDDEEPYDVSSSLPDFSRPPPGFMMSDMPPPMTYPVCLPLPCEAYNYYPQASTSQSEASAGDPERSLRRSRRSSENEDQSFRHRSSTREDRSSKRERDNNKNASRSNNRESRCEWSRGNKEREHEKQDRRRSRERERKRRHRSRSPSSSSKRSYREDGQRNY